MGKIFHKLFSLPAGVVAGIVAISVLVFAILQERSVQPLQNHLWAEEMVSLPMIDGVVFNQVVVIPEMGPVRIDEGESIRTELSCKYDRSGLTALLRSAGLDVEEWREDSKGFYAVARAAPV